ncbi:Abi family protein, partial [Enterococcus faecium]|nr:Abi family protein [Enterococcus faecium]
MHLHFKSNHPFKSFEEQLSILEKRGLAIDDYKLALDAMESFSYYTIVNGYKDLFLDTKYQNRGIERFKKGTTFSMLYQAHWIDLSMSSLLFKYTLAVEKKLKTQVSYLIGEKLSIEESLYLDKKFYGQNKANRGKLFQLKEKINEAKEKDISAKYYWEKEHNVPPWIAAKAISFGSIVTWYS